MMADGDVPAGVSESPMVLPVIHIGHQGEDEMIADSVSKDDKSIASVGVGSLRGEGGAIKKEASNGASSTLSAPAASSSGGIFHRLLSLGDSKTKTAEDVDATPAAVAAVRTGQGEYGDKGKGNMGIRARGIWGLGILLVMLALC